MTEKLVRGVQALLTVIRVVAAILLICSVALNFANIIGRYFFAVSISWAEEIMLFLMVGCVFLGSSLVSWSNRQIRMDVIVGMLPLPVRKVLALISDLIFMATCFALAIFAWPVIEQLAAFDERSQAANFPLVIPQAMIPIGLTLMACLVGVRLIVQRGSRAAPGVSDPQH
jgi:TRAP-type C4-dicarboxylate transport system permease small subunit